MANMKHYSDLNGETVELATVSTMQNAEFATRFPLIKGKRSDGYSMWVGWVAGARCRNEFALPVTRVIEYKAHASKHVCDSRCMNATGKVMKCECACGGKNHGKGGGE